jgi:hypothetical protein
MFFEGLSEGEGIIRKMKRRKSLVAQDWQVVNGIGALPPSVRAKVIDAIRKARLGEEPQDDFFSQKFRPETKLNIVQELLFQRLSHTDIARLMGMSGRGIEFLVARIRQLNAENLPVTWNRDRFVDTVDRLEDDADINRAYAESEPDSRVRVMYLANAIRAGAEAGRLRLQLGLSKEWLAALREGMKRGGDQAPDPNQRIDMIDWVYRNRIMKQIQPSEDAEL